LRIQIPGCRQYETERNIDCLGFLVLEWEVRYVPTMSSSNTTAHSTENTYSFSRSLFFFLSLPIATYYPLFFNEWYDITIEILVWKVVGIEFHRVVVGDDDDDDKEKKTMMQSSAVLAATAFIDTVASLSSSFSSSSLLLSMEQCTMPVKRCRSKHLNQKQKSG